jgi:hypothetical protein
MFRHVFELELPCEVRYDLSVSPPRVACAPTEGPNSAVVRLANGLVSLVAQDVGAAAQKLLLGMGEVADSVGNWREVGSDNYLVRWLEHWCFFFCSFVPSFLPSFLPSLLPSSFRKPRPPQK